MDFHGLGDLEHLEYSFRVLASPGNHLKGSSSKPFRGNLFEKESQPCWGAGTWTSAADLDFGRAQEKPLGMIGNPLHSYTFRSFWENGKLFLVNSIFFVNNNKFTL